PLLQSLSRLLFLNASTRSNISTLSLHDALPIYLVDIVGHAFRPLVADRVGGNDAVLGDDEHRLGAAVAEDVDAVGALDLGGRERSEEHTSELQSQSNLVCRLLLEKKNKTTQQDS